MTWFTEQRQAWIAETLRIFGFINRGHIQRKFGVTHQIASTDLRAFQQTNPGAIVYDRIGKTYRAVKWQGLAP